MMEELTKTLKTPQIISYSNTLRAHTNEFNNVWASGVFFWVIKIDNFLLFHAPWKRNGLNFLFSPPLSARLCFLDQYYPVYLTNLIRPPSSQLGQLLVFMCVILHVSPGSGNIIRAYSFHLEQKPNLQAPKNRASCFSFLSRTHYTLHRSKHYWPLLQSIIALV